MENWTDKKHYVNSGRIFKNFGSNHLVENIDLSWINYNQVYLAANIVSTIVKWIKHIGF